MGCVDVQHAGVGGGAGEGVETALEGADEEDLGEFAAVVEEGGAQVGVEFGGGGEGGGGWAGAVEVAGLDDEARGRGGEEGGEEEEGQQELGEVVYLHVAFEVVAGFPVGADA